MERARWHVSVNRTVMMSPAIAWAAVTIVICVTKGGHPLSVESQKEAARRLYVEVFGAGNLSAADEILAPDCVSHAGTGGHRRHQAAGSAAADGHPGPDFNAGRSVCRGRSGRKSLARFWDAHGAAGSSYRNCRPDRREDRIWRDPDRSLREWQDRRVVVHP